MQSVRHIVDPLSPLLRDAFDTAKSFIPLKSLRHGFLEDLFLYVEPQSVIVGHTLFEDGAYDNQYIYLQSGHIKLIYSSGREELLVAGEHLLPLAHTQPRACKAVAVEDCTILRIDADRLDRTLSWSQMTDHLLSELSFDRDYDGDIDWMKTIIASNLFFKVPPVNANLIFKRLIPMHVSAGHVVIQQGDIGDACYFLRKGTAQVFKNNGDGGPEHIADILEGRCFGEDALVESKPRNATITMSSDGVLMRLEKADFYTLLKEPAVEEISTSELDQLPEMPILIDVRTDAEYTRGHLAASVNIPLSILAMKKRILSTAQAYVLYCDSGRRSRPAAYFLGKEGYNVVSLAGGLHGQKITDRVVSGSGYILRDGELVQSDAI